MEQPEDANRKAMLSGAAWAVGGWVLMVTLIGGTAAWIFYLN